MADRKYQHNARVRSAWVIICRYDSREKTPTAVLTFLRSPGGRRGCTNHCWMSLTAWPACKFCNLILRSSERPVLKLMRNCAKKMNFVPDRRRHARYRGSIIPDQPQRLPSFRAAAEYLRRSLHLHLRRPRSVLRASALHRWRELTVTAGSQRRSALSPRQRDNVWKSANTYSSGVI
jgi:hypothetical protein